VSARWLGTPTPFRYGGAWGYKTDPSGILHLGAREYWPEVGRFVQREPRHGPAHHRLLRARIAESGPVSSGGPVLGPVRGHGHPYVYADGRPTLNVDPSGYDYVDAGITVPTVGLPGRVGLGLMGGVMVGANPCTPDPKGWWDIYGYLRKYVHPYLGVGGGTLGISINYAPGSQTPGHGYSAQLSGYTSAPLGPPMGGAGGRRLCPGGETFGELGVGAGLWAGVYYTF